jgi:hypothetical protein
MANKNYKINLPVFILILSVYTSGHVVLVDTMGIRLILQLLMMIFMFLYILSSTQKGMNKHGFVVLFVIAPSMIGELLIRGSINNILGYGLLIALIFILLTMKYRDVINFIETINSINYVLAIIAIIGLGLSISSSNIFDALLSRADYYNPSFLSGMSKWSLLGHADTWIVMLDEKVPRIVAHLQQASLVPAYFLLPLSISLAFSPVNKLHIVFFILLFVLLSMGGASYVSLLMCLLIYIFINYIPRHVLILAPFILLCISSIMLVYLYIDIYDVELIKELSRGAASSYGEDLDDGPINNRMASAVARMSLMGFQVIGFIENFPLPAGEELTKMTIGGNLMTNALRGGVIGFVATIAMYYVLFRGVTNHLIKYKSSNKVKRLGSSLLYALIFQSFIYNDFGFSTYYGYIMFVVIILLSSPNKNTRQVP